MKLCFWKKSKLKKVRTKKLIYENKEFEVGYTTVRLLFKDGRILSKRIYGSVSQHSDVGRDEEREGLFQRRKVEEPTATDVIVMSSSEHAIHCIRNALQETLYPYLFVDDELNPTRSVIGELIEVSKVKTYPYKKTFPVARVIPK